MAKLKTRAEVIDSGFGSLQRWAVRLLVIGAAAYAVGWLIGKTWVVWFPVAMALVITSVLAPPANWLKRRNWPPPLAAGLVVIAFLGIFAGLVTLIVPQVVDQAPDLAERTSTGLGELRDWLVNGPLGVSNAQIATAIEAAQDKLKASAESISRGVFTTLGAATSVVVNFFVVLILTFLFVKDGHKFLPWLGTVADRKHGDHAVEVLNRAWASLGGFIRTQAVVALIDASIIGGALLILGVPLWLPLAVITFIGGFIPIIGAVISGAVAVLVTFVTNSPMDALIAAVVVLGVQQFEGNVLSPWLQGKTMSLHPAVVLLSVLLGGTLFGVTGAFLAVPLAAAVAEVLRYLDERIDLKTERQPSAHDYAD